MVFGIISIGCGVLAIIDALIHLFRRTIVQGREVQRSSKTVRLLLRLLEIAIGIGFIILGVWLLGRG